MPEDEVPVVYGLISGPTPAWAYDAPNAMPYAIGGCVLGNGPVRVHYCPTCRQVYQQVYHQELTRHAPSSVGSPR